MNFTRTEKTAIVGILFDMMNIDGNVDIREKLYFLQLKNTLLISDEDIEEARQLDINTEIAILKSMSYENRLAVSIMLGEMLKADGKVDKNETKLFLIVCAACDLIPQEAKLKTD